MSDKDRALLVLFLNVGCITPRAANYSFHSMVNNFACFFTFTLPKKNSHLTFKTLRTLQSKPIIFFSNYEKRYFVENWIMRVMWFGSFYCLNSMRKQYWFWIIKINYSIPEKKSSLRYSSFNWLPDSGSKHPIDWL